MVHKISGVVISLLLVGTGTLFAQTNDDFLPYENIFDTLSLDLKVNGSDGPVNVMVGERITISWESDGAKRCRGNWSKKDLRLNGKIAGKLSRSLTTSVTVRIACIDGDGNREDDSVLLNISSTPIISTPSKIKAVKILVIPVDFLDSKSRPYTREELHRLVFEGQVQRFFEEQSYGQSRLEGDTLTWTTLPRNGAADSSCGAVTQKDIGEIVIAQNIDLTPYSVVLVLANSLVGDCADIGPSSRTVNGKTFRFATALVAVSQDSHPSGYYPQPFSWAKDDFALSHELGHALGANHANGLDCGEEQVSVVCVLREYQNNFDVMGAGKYGLHFNAILKDWLGWLAPENTLVITKSGRYTLHSFEKREGVKIAKISVPGSASNEYVYAEYRTGVGFDAKMAESKESAPGLFINVVKKDPSGAFAPYLVDVNPSPLSWNEDMKDAMLVLGGSRSAFVDPVRGITIGPVISQETGRIIFDVKIEIPQCVRGAPAIIKHFINPNFIFPDRASLAASESGVISMGFSNTDYPVCGASRFTVTPLLPASWSYTMLMGESPFTAWSAEKEIIVNPGDANNKFINFSVPKDTAPGIYSVRYKVVNVTSGLETEGKFEVTVTPLTSL